eukprot:5401617-Prymnesium_polylepis.1
MFMLRQGAVPLRTTDGGSSWSELASAAALFKYGATMDGSLSWTGARGSGTVARPRGIVARPRGTVARL